VEETILDQLLLRPAKMANESLHGYLLRFSNMNRMKGMGALYKGNGLCKRQFMRHFVGTPRAKRDRRLLRYFDLGAIADNRTRICPYCFRSDDPYVNWEWSLPVQLRCTKHNCMLVDRCPRCMKCIGHDRKHFDRCDCGHQFRDIEEQPVSNWVRDMEDAFMEAFCRQRPELVMFDGLNAARLLRSFAKAKAKGIVERCGVMKTRSILSSDDFTYLKKCFEESEVGLPIEFVSHFVSQGNDASAQYRLSRVDRFFAVANEVSRLYNLTVTSCTSIGGVGESSEAKAELQSRLLGRRPCCSFEGRHR
jgi:hypothetical protein